MPLQIIPLLLRYISGHFSVLLLGGGYCRQGAKAMNLSSIEVQVDNKQVVKLLCVTKAEPSSLGMCFHCFQIFVLQGKGFDKRKDDDSLNEENDLFAIIDTSMIGLKCVNMDPVWSLETSGQFLMQMDPVWSLETSRQFLLQAKAMANLHACVLVKMDPVWSLETSGGFLLLVYVCECVSVFSWYGFVICAKAMHLSSIEVQEDNKQVVKLLCITEAEPSSLGMCFHCFQRFVLTDMEISLSFCWCSYILGRQTRQPTGLHNPLTRTNPRPSVLQDRVEKRKDDDSLNEENDLFAIIDTSMIGLKCMDPVWSLETSGQFLLQLCFFDTSVAISRCCCWVVVTADEVQVAGDGFIGYLINLCL
ncbi:hypothetical protein RHMOL_Rhmol11G0220600 [Rhododendron molle]|uniref:Uncharacterized protein n=1 Tax=Rhododendron molle TaxID=49168 RepID=A0ACC0LV75_RHOML|nr:hypothetical protein RHMOL_Rhmol11G0220600 [Rhododendron molle]